MANALQPYNPAHHQQIQNHSANLQLDRVQRQRGPIHPNQFKQLTQSVVKDGTLQIGQIPQPLARWNTRQIFHTNLNQHLPRVTLPELLRIPTTLETEIRRKSNSDTENFMRANGALIYSYVDQNSNLRSQLNNFIESLERQKRAADCSLIQFGAMYQSVLEASSPLENTMQQLDLEERTMRQRKKELTDAISSKRHVFHHEQTKNKTSRESLGKKDQIAQDLTKIIGAHHTKIAEIVRQAMKIETELKGSTKTLNSKQQEIEKLRKQIASSQPIQKSF